MLYYQREITFADYCKLRAAEIVQQIKNDGMLQVRLHKNRLLTFTHPAPRGHGTRGLLVGVYNNGTHEEWIVDDIQSLSTCNELQIK